MLLELPAVTQAQRIPKRFRRTQSTEEDVGWVFKKVSGLLRVVFAVERRELKDASLPCSLDGPGGADELAGRSIERLAVAANS